MGLRVGLDYTALLSTLTLMKIKPARRLFEKVRCLEAGALAAMHDKDLSELIDG